MADPNHSYTGSQVAELSANEETKYRKKCKALKRRISEIESTNEQTVIKLARVKRYIQRVRLERAFLLEKLEENTPRKVPGSDGSPSPPGTPSLEAYSIDALEGFSPQPITGSASPAPPRPDTHDNNALETPRDSPAPQSEKKKKKIPRDPLAPRRPRNPFLLFCEVERESVRAAAEVIDGEPIDIARELGRVWADMSEMLKKPYRDSYEADKIRYAREMQEYLSKRKDKDGNAIALDQDLLDDEEDAFMEVEKEFATPVPANKTGGFTAVNRA